MPEVDVEKEAAILTLSCGGIDWLDTTQRAGSLDVYDEGLWANSVAVRGTFSTDGAAVNILFPCVIKGCERKVA